MSQREDERIGLSTAARHEGRRGLHRQVTRTFPANATVLPDTHNLELPPELEQVRELLRKHREEQATS